MKPFILDRASSILMVIDLQEKLLPFIENAERVVAITRRLLRAAREMQIPTLVTEQYPKGLGKTSPSLELEKYPDIPLIEKIHFSSTHDTTCMHYIETLKGRDQIVLAGVEAHICVLSTALGLLQKGYRVVLAADAVSSRNSEHKKWALEAASSAGALVIPEESVVYQWLHQSGTREFKNLLPLYSSPDRP
ncbi:MAG TPA: isochorismatase family protein [Synergistaceae bacterium]|nr:isochorismatase family protein [Synergistaceae bacterium]